MMDVIREIVEEEKKFFERYRDYAKVIKEVAMEELGEAKVFVFGSVIEGRHTPSSDIDVLVVSENMPKSMEERAKIRAKILRRVGVTSPFEIHLANPREFEWYRRFVKRFEEV